MNNQQWNNILKIKTKNNFMKDYRQNPSAKFSGEAYGKKVTIEIDHSDFDMDELMGIFKSIALGLEFSESSWNEWIKESAYDIECDERAEEWNEEEGKYVPVQM